MRSQKRTRDRFEHDGEKREGNEGEIHMGTILQAPCKLVLIPNFHFSRIAGQDPVFGPVLE